MGSRLQEGRRRHQEHRSAAGQQADVPLFRSNPHLRLDLGTVFAGASATAYCWDIAAEEISWATNVTEALRVPRAEMITTTAGFQLLVSAGQASERYAAIAEGHLNHAPRPEDVEHGVGYCVEYKFNPDGRRSDSGFWVEDQGRWYPGPDGRPTAAFGIIRHAGERKRRELDLIHDSQHDALSDAFNRRTLTRHLEAAIAEAELHERPAAFLLAAIDNLTMINDTFGFSVGDQTLKAVAGRIASRLRDGDTLGHFSANKFGLIIRDCGPSAMRIVAQRVMDAVGAQAIATGACDLPTTISIGGVQFPEQVRTVEEIYAAGLEALDCSKDSRNVFSAYSPDKKRDLARSRNARVVDEVVTAVRERRMLIALQPIVHTASKEPAFHEALLRMTTPDGEIVSAGSFMPLAEQLGLSRLIDQHVLGLTITVLKERPDITISVNVSGTTANDPEWLVALHRLTLGQPDLANRLIIEITETAAIQDLDQSINFVDTLKELGCRVAIDDFGAGYTSFQNLKYLGVDLVKIDGSFIAGLNTAPDDLVFVEKLAELAQHFSIETVAEWVDDDETADKLEKVGIDYLQGFHFGRPVLVQSETETAKAASGTGDLTQAPAQLA